MHDIGIILLFNGGFASSSVPIYFSFFVDTRVEPVPTERGPDCGTKQVYHVQDGSSYAAIFNPVENYERMASHSRTIQVRVINEDHQLR